MMGFGVTSALGRNSFLHPFYPTLNGIAGVQFSRGLVSYIEPRIGVDFASGIPISGMVNGVQGPQPTLALDPSVIASGDNRTWACAEITVDAKGEISTDSRVMMAHRSNWFYQDTAGKTGRCPVCMILWNGKTPSQVFPILYFNPVAAMADLNAGGATPLARFFFL